MIIGQRTGYLYAFGTQTFVQICTRMMKVRHTGINGDGEGFGRCCDRCAMRCVVRRCREGCNRPHGCMQEAADQCQTNQDCDSFQGRCSVH